MKKIFTFSAAVFLSAQAFTQSGNGGGLPSITTIGEVPLGSSFNAFTVAGTRTQLWADPALNEVVLIRRDDATGNELYFDVSQDGGLNWNLNQGPLYSGSINNPRYPQCALVNPSGVPDPDSAYITFLSPLTGPSTWSGIAEGQRKILPGSLPSSSADTVNLSGHQIPSGYMATKQGVIWSVDAQFTSGAIYNDALLVRKGTWNSANWQYDYTEQVIIAPVTTRPDGTRNYSGCSIAFAPDGQTGYVVMCGQFAGIPNPDSVYYPVVFVTYDGGLNWSYGMPVNLSGVETILNLGTGVYTLGTQFDIAVDANGQLHIFCSVLKSNSSWGGYGEHGLFGLFDIFSFNSNSWKAQLIFMPQTFQGTFGDGGINPIIVEQNRPQIAIDSSATKLFFTWAETDTTIYGTIENIFPDLYLLGFDIGSLQLTGNLNITSGTASIGNGGSIFHNTSYYAITGATDFTIPVSVASMMNPPISTASVINHFYLTGITVNSSDFTQPASPVNLGVWTGGFNPFFSGIVFFDLNSNGVKDGGEVNLTGMRLDVTPDQLTVFTSSIGEYHFYGLTGGSHLVSPHVPTDWVITSDSLTYTVTDDTVSQSGFDFGINAISPENELQVSLTSWIPRCNWDIPFYLSYQNSGTTILSGQVVFIPDSATTFVSSVPPPDATSADTLFYNFTNLYPFSPPQLITIVLHLPNSPGDTLFSGSFIQMDSSGTLTAMDESNLISVITCSFDPNDKAVSPEGIYENHYTLFSDTLSYTIRFQNTGNDTAFTVVIRDTLDTSLDVSTFLVLGYSHEVSTTIFPGNIVEFRFDNILLPDSTTDLEGSNGFVQFRITPLAGIVLPEVIENDADIYFDSNPPVRTNTVSNMLVLQLPLEIPEKEKRVSCVQVSPNPFHRETTMNMDPSLVTAGSVIRIMDAMGKLVFSSNVDSQSIVIKRGLLSSGLYFYSVTDGKTKTCYGKMIIE